MGKTKSGRKVSILSIICYVIAACFATLAFLFGFGVITEIGGFDVILFVSGLAILGIGIILNFFHFKRKNSTAKTIAICEMIVIMVGAVIGFILPAFTQLNLGTRLGTATLWLGIILILHATFVLTFNKLGSLKVGNLYFFLCMAFLVFGGYLLGSNIIDQFIDSIVVAIFAGLAILMIFLGFSAQKKSKGTAVA